MTTYQIVCKELTSDGQRINRVGLAKPPKTNAEFAATPKEINSMIDNGDTCFFTDEDGARVDVSQFGDDFIRTDPDGKFENNLRHIRDCSFK